MIDITATLHHIDGDKLKVGDIRRFVAALAEADGDEDLIVHFSDEMKAFAIEGYVEGV